jgi:hypothetical protein
MARSHRAQKILKAINQEDIQMMNVELNDAVFSEQCSKYECSDVNSELDSQTSHQGDGEDYSTYVISLASTTQSWRWEKSYM